MDPTEPTPDEADLSVEILRLARRLTEEGAELVCHAFTILGEHLLRNRISKSEYHQYLDEEVRARVPGRA